MKKRDFLGLAAGVGAVAGLAAAAGPAVAQARRTGPIDVNQKDFVSKNLQPSTVDWNYKPRRLNKMIELWEDGQPAYVQVAGLGAGVDPYAQGVKLARTWFDCIGVGMEHGALDFSQLREFMRGLVDGGPTPSGHRTPTVIVETPVIGLDEAYARANTWVLGQLLDCGVHGFLLCHAQDAKAVQTFAQMASRYPFPRPGINLPMRGLRGANAGYAAEVWGMNVNQYNHVADLWPLNPKGELIFGVKIEDIYGVEQADKIIALPGIGMAEWGPGDQTYWLYGLDIMSENPPSMNEVWNRPEMRQIRQKVLNACKKNNVPFLNWATDDKSSPDNVIKQIQEGAKVLMCSEEVAIIGREYTKRKMPV